MFFLRSRQLMNRSRLLSLSLRSSQLLERSLLLNVSRRSRELMDRSLLLSLSLRSRQLVDRSRFDSPSLRSSFLLVYNLSRFEHVLIFTPNDPKYPQFWCQMISDNLENQFFLITGPRASFWCIICLGLKMFGF